MGSDLPSSDSSVSVVIPVGSAIVGLREQLESLVPQLAKIRNSELILSINDRKTEKSQELDDLKKYLLESGLVFRIISSSQGVGPSFARNIGWSAAKGNLILFCDSDDVVDDSWVENLVAGLRNFGLVGGSLTYEDLNPPSLIGWQPDRSLGLSSKFGFLPYVATCNMGVRSEVLATVKGFDETLNTGEDIDLCWRAQFAGFNVGFIREAKVSYRLRHTFRGAFLQSFEYGRGDIALKKKHSRKIPKSLSSNLAWIFLYSFVSALASIFKMADSRKFATKIGYFLGLAKGLWSDAPKHKRVNLITE